MPAPANISQRFRQMLDDAWDARNLALPYTGDDVFVVAGIRVFLQMQFWPDPENPAHYDYIKAILKWPPS